jgi:hypothetical protein
MLFTLSFEVYAPAALASRLQVAGDGGWWLVASAGGGRLHPAFAHPQLPMLPRLNPKSTPKSMYIRSIIHLRLSTRALQVQSASQIQPVNAKACASWAAPAPYRQSPASTLGKPFVGIRFLDKETPLQLDLSLSRH